MVVRFKRSAGNNYKLGSINFSTYFAIAIEDVNPGDSIPIRLINPGNPLLLSSII